MTELVLYCTTCGDVLGETRDCEECQEHRNECGAKE